MITQVKCCGMLQVSSVFLFLPFLLLQVKETELEQQKEKLGRVFDGLLFSILDPKVSKKRATLKEKEDISERYQREVQTLILQVMYLS